MKRNKGFILHGSPVYKLAKPSFHGMTALNKSKTERGFTLIELLVVIAIISLLSSVVFASMTSVRKKARDSQRIENARQIAMALEMYEQTYSTYKVAGSGISGNEGVGYVTKTGGTYSGTSILSTLKQSGFLKTDNLKDPIFADNYYIGLCTSTNAYNVFVKLEQDQYNQATSSIINTCGGTLASNEGFSFIGATTGGTSGGGAGSIAGSYEAGMSSGGSDISFNGLTYKQVVAEDGRTWLDRNLGAVQVANAYNDSQAYGYYYQWGRGNDGHQISTGPSTSTLSSSDNPSHNSYIMVNNGINDWRNPQNASLWQGISGVNNPCPSGYRVPTQTEWQDYINITNLTSATCGSLNNCRTVAFNSSLKITSSGYRDRIGATMNNIGAEGYYWASTISGNNTRVFDFHNSMSVLGVHYRSYGFSVRCIKN